MAKLKLPKTCVHAGRWSLPIGPQWQAVIQVNKIDPRDSKHRDLINDCLALGRRTNPDKTP